MPTLAMAKQASANVVLNNSGKVSGI